MNLNCVSGLLISFSLLVATMTSKASEGIEAKSSWNERFEKEAIPAWKKYLAKVKTLSGTYTTKARQVEPLNRPWYESNNEIKQRQDCFLFYEQRIFDDFKPHRADKLSVLNTHYLFVLKRSDSSRPWAISEMTINQGKGLAMSDSAWGPPHDCLTSPVTFDMTWPFGTLGNKPGFTAKQMTPLVRDGRTFLKVDIDCPPHLGDPSSTVPSAQGWAVYDPDHSWVIHEYHLLIKHPSRSSNYHDKGFLTDVSIDYDESRPDFPIPHHISVKTNVLDQNFAAINEINLKLSDTEVPARDFTLSAYGFPEPERPRPTLWFVYALISGMVCLFLALWLRRRSKQMGTAPSSHPDST